MEYKQNKIRVEWNDDFSLRTIEVGVSLMFFFFFFSIAPLLTPKCVFFPSHQLILQYQLGVQQFSSDTKGYPVMWGNSHGHSLYPVSMPWRTVAPPPGLESSGWSPTTCIVRSWMLCGLVRELRPWLLLSKKMERVIWL